MAPTTPKRPKTPGSGRKKGSLNKTTKDAREFCASIIDNPTYQRNFRAAAIKRELHPSLEAMTWHYAKGKAPDKVQHSGFVGVFDPAKLKGLPDEELEALLNASRIAERYLTGTSE